MITAVTHNVVVTTLMSYVRVLSTADLPVTYFYFAQCLLFVLVASQLSSSHHWQLMVMSVSQKFIVCFFVVCTIGQRLFISQSAVQTSVSDWQSVRGSSLTNRQYLKASQPSSYRLPCDICFKLELSELELLMLQIRLTWKEYADILEMKLGAT